MRTGEKGRGAKDEAGCEERKTNTVLISLSLSRRSFERMMIVSTSNLVDSNVFIRR